MGEKPSIVQQATAAGLAIVLTVGMIGLLFVGTAVPEWLVQLAYFVIGGAVVGAATQWQPRR